MRVDIMTTTDGHVVVVYNGRSVVITPTEAAPLAKALRQVSQATPEPVVTMKTRGDTIDGVKARERLTMTVIDLVSEPEFTSGQVYDAYVQSGDDEVTRDEVSASVYRLYAAGYLEKTLTPQGYPVYRKKPQ